MDENSHHPTIDPQTMLEAKVRVPKHVVYRSFEAETVLLNLQTGQYHGLNRSGGRMLELLDDTGGNVREAIDRLAGEYGEDSSGIEDGLASFCAALASRGLIEVDDADGDA
ncbi:MAG: PqqD family protein [Thermoleophilaceae bacterium]